MPRHHWKLRLLTDAFEPPRLIGDQRFEWSDVEQVEPAALCLDGEGKWVKGATNPRGSELEADRIVVSIRVSTSRFLYFAHILASVF